MIGKKIRALRNEKGLTLAQLAEQVNISESYLSQLERDKVDPSVSVLRRICTVLQVPVAAFFDLPHDEPILTGKADRAVIAQENSAFFAERVSPPAQEYQCKMEAQRFVLQPQKSFCGPVDGRQLCLHLLRGTLQLTGSELKEELQQGDSIYLMKDDRLSLYNPGTEPAEGILCALVKEQEVAQ